MICGGAGDDALEGGVDNDRLFGEMGNDSLDGGLGDDRIFGQNGNDMLRGGDSKDLTRSAEVPPLKKGICCCLPCAIRPTNYATLYQAPSRAGIV